MHDSELVQLVKGTMLDAALAFELHEGKGDRWRLIFKLTIAKLPTKAGRQYRQLVQWSTMSRRAMDRICGVLAAARI